MTCAIPYPLLREIQKYSQTHIVSPGLHALMDEITRRHGPGVKAILYYGSCLQSGKEFDGIVDLFVLVNDYGSVYKRPWLSFLNWLLPPNVFYLELPIEKGKRIRAKYAIISLADFLEKTSGKTFHSYFWARFSQPVALIFFSHPRIKRAVENGLACALMTFLKNVVPCAAPRFDAKKLWLTGLNLSYSAELRPERAFRLERLWAEQGEILEAVTEVAIKALPYEITVETEGEDILYLANIPRRACALCCTAWRFRRIYGKLLSVLRLFKASFTFRAGVDYAIWKIKRHSGVQIEVSPFLRRHPALAMVVLSWRLFKSRAVR